MRNIYEVETKIMNACQKNNLSGEKLRDSLFKTLNYFQLDKKLETRPWFLEALDSIYKLGNTTDVCAPGKVNSYNDGNWPKDIVAVNSAISNGLYVGLGMKLPVKKLEEYEPLEIALNSWKLVYMYYWICFCVLMLCLIVFLLMIRRHRADLFDFTSVISRTLALGVGAALLGLIANKQQLYGALSTPMLLPICVILMFLILVIDKLSALWCNWRLKKSGQPYALEVEEEHGHGGSHHDTEHGSVHDLSEAEPLKASGHGHHDSVNLADERKSYIYTDTIPLEAQSTEYNSPRQGGFASEPLMSPPLMSPPLMSPDPATPGFGAKPSGPGGYMPVSGNQNYGA